MRKTRFFYGKRIFLFLCLVWLALLNEAAYLNIRQKENTGPAPKEEREKKEKGENNIRVLLTDSDFSTYYHPFVRLLYKGNTFTYTPESPGLSKQPLILSDPEEGITVVSITRQEGSPTYQGSLKIEKRDEGLLLINELSVEDYLKAVVPSEMPSSYGMEALKAQAVCARTYAYKQMEDARLKEYGADVDDSVNFQVYRNLSPTEPTDQAVESTRGEILCQNGEPIEAYYFSTSSGRTSTDEVWGAKEAASYLKSVACTYDAQNAYSRWNVEIPWEQLEKSIEQKTGKASVLKDIQVTKRSQSGAVIGLLAVTEEESVAIENEYEVREFLAPGECSVTGKDGKELPGGGLLPSAYFSLDTDPGVKILLEGGGYGHGVGMSQNAADEMAKEGFSYQEILDYFFKDVTIQKAGKREELARDGRSVL